MSESGKEIGSVPGDLATVRGTFSRGQPDPSGRSRRDVLESLARAGGLDVRQVADVLCGDQAARWLAGERIPAEAYLRLHPRLQDESEATFELVYSEYVLRESLGDAPTPEEFAWRFPEFADRLRRQIGLHRALDSAEGPAGTDAPGTVRTLVGPGAAADSNANDPRFPVIPGYQSFSEIGRGATGVVYKARNLALNRLVALKVIRLDADSSSDALGFGTEAESVARFRTEAESVARFQHSNIVQIFEVGRHDGLGYLALEYVEGGNLHQRLDATPQDPTWSARLAEVLARAIHYAHRRGIIHRDLKPANVLMADDATPKITDFGLAKLLERDQGETRAGTILGTPSYMAPEQVHGPSSAITPGTDVYALGAILYEMLTGRPPFRGSTPLSTLEQVTTREPLSPGILQRHTPRDLETICLKCLEKDPARRYADAEALADDLGRFLDGRPILARPASAAERAWKWARRHPGAATTLATASMAIALLIGGVIYHNARLQVVLRATDASARAAVEQRNLALKALDRLVYDVQEKLGETPATRSLRRALLDQAIAGLGEIARSAETSAPDLSRAVAHQKLGAIYRSIGRAGQAREQFEQALRLATSRAAASPRDVAAAECLGRAQFGLGALSMEDRNYEQAKGHFRTAAAYAEVVANAEPGRAGARRGLPEADIQLGRAHGFAGEYPEAVAWFDKAGDLIRRWIEDDPGSIEAKDLLAWSYRKLADVKKLSGDLAAARAQYLRAIALGREVLAAHPDDAESKKNLAVALDDLGGITAALGATEEARSLFVEAERGFGELIEADPEGVETQLKLARAQTQHAALDRDEGRFDQSRELYRRAHDRLLRLEGEGRLGGNWAFGPWGLAALREELDYCEAAPGALEDLDAARAHPSRLACRLLLLHARGQAGRGRPENARAAVSALCDLAADRDDDPYLLASTLAQSLGCLDDSPPGTEESRLRIRGADLAVAALARAVAAGTCTPARLAADPTLASIRAQPGYQALIARPGNP